MSNPLFNMFNKQNSMPPIFQQFQAFKNTFKGDARSQVQQLLNSGQISQSQYNEAVELAKQFQNLLK